ncbi:TrbI/VirB10 family protein [uncultured Caulobacter sp.]|uniref:TrbI/VirB10 family protein n=1 Tax=uncultured Caulobacter sp. TaxID=158749 RepID=UPI002605B322|nr:TrbI/VirB10 family protein [uncultured Caulobacter sp.]
MFNRTNNAATAPSIAMPLPAQTGPTTLPEARSGTSITDSRRGFLDQDSPPSTSAFRPTSPAGRYVLLAQTVIPAALISAVSSDLPGPVSAQVTRNIHDSLTGRTILIPQGSRLIGRYDSQVAFGQRRVLLAWDRVIFPDGRSLQLDRLVAGDSQGRSGLVDEINAHWGDMAKAALLSSTLGAGAAIGADDESDIARALRQGVQDTVNQTGQQVVRKQLDVQPTLTLRPGLPLTVIVTRDIVFDD